MNVKKIIIALFLLLLFTSTIHAEEGIEYYIGYGTPTRANFDNCTQINKEVISPGNFTTIHNQTFHWDAAYKITYKNNEGKIDYFIIWQSNTSAEYTFLYSFHELATYYSDYSKDNKSVAYMEIPLIEDQVYGILVDTQNISYSEEDLVHGILGLSSVYELTNSGYHYNPPIDYIDASPHDYQPHKSSKSEQWDMAINDPDWYYDHYDYGDNGDIDQYLYENYEYYE